MFKPPTGGTTAKKNTIIENEPEELRQRLRSISVCDGVGSEGAGTPAERWKRPSHVFLPGSSLFKFQSHG